MSSSSNCAASVLTATLRRRPRRGLVQSRDPCDGATVKAKGILVGDHPTASVVQHPRARRTTRQRRHHAFYVQSRFQTERHPLGDPEIDARKNHLIDCFGPLTRTNRSRCVMVEPMALSTLLARSTSSGSPPTMIESVAFFAPSEPPDTGASMSDTPARRGVQRTRETSAD